MGGARGTAIQGVTALGDFAYYGYPGTFAMSYGKDVVPVEYALATGLSSWPTRIAQR